VELAADAVAAERLDDAVAVLLAGEVGDGLADVADALAGADLADAEPQATRG
jgi:hypothetical protein